LLLQSLVPALIDAGAAMELVLLRAFKLRRQALELSQLQTRGPCTATSLRLPK
jgi:hypothetical protein